MKSQLFSAVAIAALTLASCSAPEPAPVVAPPAAPEAKVVAYALDSTSVVKWKGTMVGVYSHEGTIKFTEGNLMVKGNMVTGGNFAVNMKSITPLDTNFNAKQKHTPENLIGHLSSPDFFAVDSFPTASFVIKSVEGNVATGDLTLRGRTNSEKVENIVVTADSASVKATGTLTFDRQKYGVAYKAAKDMVLQDNIELNIELTGKAK